MTLRGDDGMTCLHLATQNGFLECAHVILGQLHLPRNFLNTQDEGGWTPLVWACENKHEPVIKYGLSLFTSLIDVYLNPDLLIGTFWREELIL